ncbi:MBL fold metallo-hydrolase [Candidatus Acetothermia bacterium]|nr:MBL fold metallo-hydrolase [Candidatus Acetothermia bacterium]MBI3643943.1 MBL fold metallo-hydrolase [Candidatus Acetothermia bacterium]
MTIQSKITIDQLKEQLDEGQEFLFFDVRPREEHQRWKLEARGDQRELNVPYREMAPQGGQNDPIGTIQKYVKSKLSNELSQDREIITLCAQGISSEDVTQALVGLGFRAKTLIGGMSSWGLFYEFKPVIESKALSLYQVSRPARGCLGYVVASGSKAIVIDPLRHTEPYLDFAQEKSLKIEAVLDTHGHADHISGGRALADAVGVHYFLHPYDAIHPIDVLPATIDFEYLRDGQELSVGDIRIEALHIPGHTLGNIAFRVNQKYLITGDSIFISSIARPDLGGRGDLWAPIHYRSLTRLLALPDQILVLPGHFSKPAEANGDGLYVASLGSLKATNEGLQIVRRGEKAFVEYILKNLPEFPPQYIEIKRVNAGLLKPDEDKASELELGRNICALAKAY